MCFENESQQDFLTDWMWVMGGKEESRMTPRFLAQAAMTVRVQLLSAQMGKAVMEQVIGEAKSSAWSCSTASAF